ncbi:Site-specific recombinase XerD [Erythrobacter litoralis]|nr:Site-specific recombinase XerD [Erythrobacter litoralis]
MADVIDTYMTRGTGRVKNPDSYRWMFDKYVIPHFGDWQLEAIKRRDLADYLDTIADRHGMTTSRRVGGLLKRLFKFAVSRDIIEADPAAALILPGAEVQRERTLTEAELRALWVATDPASRGNERNKAGRLAAHPSMFPWGAYFRLLLLTGQRRGEVAGMRWADIDLKARTWSLASTATKSARAHLVPLPPAAVALLEALPRLSATVDGKDVPSPYVLTTNGAAPISMFSKPKGWLDAAMRKALGDDLDHWRIHDLRRTVSTGLARLGVEPFVRRRVLNHALQGVDAIYDQFDYLEPKRAALDLWAAEVDRIVNGEPKAANVIKLEREA